MGCRQLKKVLFFLLLGYSASVLSSRWNTNLLGGPHEFRETQTAITVYWLLHGGPWLAYWTPVLGPPWSIPFEFPLFQWIVAGVAETGVALDNAGRLVSWSFGIATLWPLWSLSETFGADPWVVGCLFLASPLYLLWGTAFLIETCALFMAACFLVAMIRRRWVLGLAFGVLAALTKLPTFVVFAAAALVL